ncbi:MAG TPA: hypothetical protein VF820_04120 [Patescibacteria group bacterium]
MKLRSLIPYIFLALLAYVFVAGIIGQHVLDADTWYHTKSGEIFATHGIVFKDVFSNFASQREWIPFEWLFQVILYLFVHTFSLNNLVYFVSFFVFLQIAVLYFFLRKTFTLKPIFAFLLCFAFLEITQSFISARTQIVAIIFFITNLNLILYYILQKKNLLWISLPITLLWSNLHASSVLNVPMFLGFAVLLVFAKKALKQDYSLQQAKILALFGLGNLLLSLLPPVGYLQYVLVGQYLQNNHVISEFVYEWGPLLQSPAKLYPYVAVLGVVGIASGITIYFKKPLTYLLFVPFVLMALSGFTAIRNTYYGYLGLIFLAGWALSLWKIKNKYMPLFYIATGFIFCLFAGQLIYKQMYPENSIMQAYPVNAMRFIQKTNIQGNLFNEYSFGGFLLYNLYPKHTVFIDGRMDPYMCCELYDYQKLYDNKYLPDDQYHTLLNNLWNKYNISYILIKTQKNTYTTKVSHILSLDKNWNLVYWDDSFEIFVRNDNKNTALLKQYAALGATPYEDVPYKKGLEKQAIADYSRMIAITDSAISENALGLLLWQDKQYATAQQDFEKAVNLNANFASPYVNLAAIYTLSHEYDKAVSMYKKALILDPTRGIIYIRLGQLYKNVLNDTAQANAVWQKGVQNAEALSDLQQLQQLLAGN